MKFYTHIAGLRAWAVALVCLYHFNVSGLGGGFIGVDIFFVISGFLMGGILDRALRDPHRKRFWAFDFILARGQRILPALIVVILAWMIWGWLQLTPDYFRTIALEGLRAIIFRSNEFYAKDSDYFAASANLRLFLHNWSLSVEWSFYLLIAGVAAALSFVRQGARAFVGVTGLFVVASFVWMLSLRQSNQTEAFFFLMPRIWELGFGILAWHFAQSYAPQRLAIKRAVEISGFAMIALCLVLAHHEGGWPGPLTLLPVIGTGMILIAANERSVLTAPRAFQGLGEISYSVYLWHWPICVMLAYNDLLEDPLWKIAGIIASLIAGALSWWLIERPSRHLLSAYGRMGKTVLLFIGILATALTLAAVRKFDGFHQRLDPEVYTMTQRVKERSSLDKDCLVERGELQKPCHFGADKNPDLLILGDSHAAAILGAIAETDYAATHSIEAWLHSGCAPVFDIKNQYGLDLCAEFMQKAEAHFSTVPPSVPLLIISRLPQIIEGENALQNRAIRPEYWLDARPQAFDATHRATMIEGLAESICRIGRGRKIMISEPIPEFTTDPILALETASMRGKPLVPLSIPRAEVDQRHASSLAAITKAGQLCGAEMIPVSDLFCDAEICSSWQEGIHLYRDDDHLSQDGARFVAPRFEAAMAR